MHPITRHNPLDGVQLLFKKRCKTVPEYGTVIGKRHMNISTMIKQCFDQSSRYIGQTTGFGRKEAGHAFHAVRQIGDLRGNDEYTGICHFTIPIDMFLYGQLYLPRSTNPIRHFLLIY